MKRVFQSSSDLQKACRNLQVDPSIRKRRESRVSSNSAIISSGRIWKGPMDLLAFTVAVYWFPEGLTPSECCGIDSCDSSTSSESIPPPGWTLSGAGNPDSAGIADDFIATSSNKSPVAEGQSNEADWRRKDPAKTEDYLPQFRWRQNRGLKDAKFFELTSIAILLSLIPSSSSMNVCK